MTVIGWCWNGDGRGHNMIRPSWEDEPLGDMQPSGYFNEIYGKLVGV